MTKNIMNTTSIRAKSASGDFIGTGNTFFSEATGASSGSTTIINFFSVCNTGSVDATVSLRYRDNRNLNGYFCYKHPLKAHESKMLCTWDTPIYLSNNDTGAGTAYLWLDVYNNGSAVHYFMSYMEVT